MSVHRASRTIAWLWAATLLLVVIEPIERLWRPAFDVPGWMRASTVDAIVIVAALLVGVFAPVAMALVSPRVRHRLHARWSAIAPASRVERRWFVALAVTAGICEELIHRGFLVAWLGGLGLDATVAIVIAALIFGLAHVEQGWVGVVGNAGIALVMTMLFVATGSLLVPMVIHVLLNLRVLLVGWR